MNNKINVVQPTTFPAGMNVQNSGVGLTQLLPGHTKISGPSAIASVGVVINAGVPGQFQQSTRMSIQDGFGKVLTIKR
jgi:hypothetical protein